MSPITHQGNFSKTENFLSKATKLNMETILRKYGEQGANALAQNTPIDSGETAQSWNYRIETSRGGYKLIWTNSNMANGVPVAILLQYGHATKNGSYVEGRDYINPVMKPIFEKLSQELWKEVTGL